MRIALAFPDPDDYRMPGASSPEGCQLFQPCNLSSGPPVGLWHAVERTRAQRVWEAFDARGQATFDIQPDDIYSVAGSVGQLTCSDSAPVVRKMGGWRCGDAQVTPPGEAQASEAQASEAQASEAQASPGVTRAAAAAL